MFSLREVSPIWHAVAWIGVYVVAVFVGDAISAKIGVDNAATASVLLFLSVVLVGYLRHHGRLAHYGVRRVRRADFTRTLWYLPLLVIVALQFLKGPRHGLDAQTTVLIAVLMLGVGFWEELIFRGLLYRALRTERGVLAAVLISGVTFGIGHVVNLARGYTGFEQFLQVLIGVALGVVLALIFAVTGTIMPGVAFHILLNISGNITATDGRDETLVVAVSVLVCAAYLPYLFRQLARYGEQQPYDETAATAATVVEH